jgi:rhodanese-related sulfurtransferase
MTGYRAISALPILALALTACTQPTPEPAPAEKPKYRKPVRMNGRGKLASIPLEQVFQLQQSGKALIYDARPGFFYGLGHIPGAINLPKHNCDEAIQKREGEIKAALADGKTLIVYCSGITCPDARAVANHLSGFTYPAAIFSGGWDAWKDAGLPTE